MHQLNAPGRGIRRRSGHILNREGACGKRPYCQPCRVGRLEQFLPPSAPSGAKETQRSSSAPRASSLRPPAMATATRCAAVVNRSKRKRSGFEAGRPRCPGSQFRRRVSGLFSLAAGSENVLKTFDESPERATHFMGLRGTCATSTFLASRDSLAAHESSSADGTQAAARVAAGSPVAGSGGRAVRLRSSLRRRQGGGVACSSEQLWCGGVMVHFWPQMRDHGCLRLRLCV